MLAIVKRLLNRRVGAPLVNAPKLLPLEPGATIEIIETVSGDRIDGNNTWYKSPEGWYVWSGGIENQEFIKLLISENDIDSSFWVKHFGIDSLFNSLKHKVEQIRITMLDTGIDPLHNDLKGIVAESKNFVWPGKPINDEDGHGTHCAGILAGTGKERIKGVLPGIKLNIGKIMASPDPHFGGLTKDILLEALDFFGSRSDIISISAGIAIDDAKVHDVIKNLANNNVIIIAAIGNTDFSSNNGVYPAKYQECISVGALNSYGLLSKYTIKDSKIDICFPAEKIISTLPEHMGIYGSKSGTSMATPFIAGLVTLMKAKNPNWGITQIREKLKAISVLRSLQDFSYRVFPDSPIDL